NLSPKFVWLEAEDFDDARVIIKDNLSQLSDKNQWQIYLKALGQIGFKKYVKERNPTIKIKQDNSANLIDDVSFLWINDFRLCLIIFDNLVDNLIIVPNKLITSAEIAAHFYVLLEVLEEEEKLNIYGFWRYDELFRYSQSLDFKSQPDENFQLPLYLVDTELNNLLLYTRFLKPSAITLFALEDYRSRSVSPREK
ncbi:MAG: DUF1822 family protein, partial [Rivularia sp. T60_A2020_040]|nr:DUF1822 family protein [Rivularia sp. T60_A2020_040]